VISAVAVLAIVDIIVFRCSCGKSLTSAGLNLRLIIGRRDGRLQWRTCAKDVAVAKLIHACVAEPKDEIITLLFLLKECVALGTDKSNKNWCRYACEAYVFEAGKREPKYG